MPFQRDRPLYAIVIALGGGNCDLCDSDSTEWGRVAETVLGGGVLRQYWMERGCCHSVGRGVLDPLTLGVR